MTDSQVKNLGKYVYISLPCKRIKASRAGRGGGMRSTIVMTRDQYRDLQCAIAEEQNETEREGESL